ncbi:MAG: hypothetical protein ACRDQ5_28175 [Sciscionella sp.]
MIDVGGRYAWLMAALGGQDLSGLGVDRTLQGSVRTSPTAAGGLNGVTKVADRSGAKYTISLGECDLSEDAARLEDLGSGEQRAVPLAAVATVTREALG